MFFKERGHAEWHINQDRYQIRVCQKDYYRLLNLFLPSLRIDVPRPRLFKVGLVAFNPSKLVSIVNVVDGVANDVDQVVLQQTKP